MVILFIFYNVYISVFFVFCFVFWGGRDRIAERKYGVYLILLCWHTSLGSDKGAPWSGTYSNQCMFTVNGEQVEAIRYKPITFPERLGEQFYALFLQLHRMRDFAAQLNWLALCRVFLLKNENTKGYIKKKKFKQFSNMLGNFILPMFGRFMH